MEDTYFLSDEFADMPKTSKEWQDVSQKDFTNRRVESFKVFQREFILLHLFSAGTYDEVEYFHVVVERMVEKIKNNLGHVTEYYVMSKEKILEVFDLKF